MQMGKVTQQNVAIAEAAVVTAGPLSYQSEGVAGEASVQGTVRV
jgi:hypothetical protein